MDGFETAARIKGRNRTKNVPIIFLTAVDTDKNNTFRGYAAGAADYIAKPFDPWVLRAKVQVFVDLWVAGRRLATQAAFLRRQIGGGGRRRSTSSASSGSASPRSRRRSRSSRSGCSPPRTPSSGTPPIASPAASSP